VASSSEAEIPRSDIVQEATELVQAGQANGLTLRLIGGVAIQIRSNGVHPSISRAYRDIDFVAPKHASSKVSKFFLARGYTQDEQFNALHGHFRLIFFDTKHNRQVDIFVGKFEMCHVLPVTDRLQIHPLTLPPADLLMTKLQIVELNDKDQRDLLSLLLTHVVGRGDPEQIDAGYIAKLCANDWGLWRTCTRNLERLGLVVKQYPLDPADEAKVRAGLATLVSGIEEQPKPLRWKARAVVGERMQWYELPEEVGN